jgi:hypothetical protein
MAILDEMQAAKEEARGRGTRKQAYVWRIGWSAQPAVNAGLAEAGAPPLKHGVPLLGLPWESTNHFDGWELHRVSKEYARLAELL